ncbi:two-component system regulatory protein YycI [Gorillibacterium sp. sgz5001074]|uniref:two-component system regulatory protein YycI n=1 Tax=Gorillibacterium sp. sgz5001074 TaxID=3446695 RepID=UPI003F678E21
MNWGRAKTILIMAFLFLNVLLGYQLWADRFSPTASERDSATLIEDTEKLLDTKSIRVISAIPKDTPKLSTINVRYPEAYREPKEMELAKPIRFISLMSRTTLREIQSKSLISHFDQYRLDSPVSKDGVYVFHQLYRELPMFDVVLQLFAENGEITGYKQTYVEVKSGGGPNDPSGQKIISAYTAIRTLAESYLSEGAVITDIKLGYHGQLFDSEDQTLVPNWRITLSDGEPYYVHAFTGAVEAIQSYGRGR